jgi:hypothetical protein
MNKKKVVTLSSSNGVPIELSVTQKNFWNTVNNLPKNQVNDWDKAVIIEMFNFHFYGVKKKIPVETKDFQRIKNQFIKIKIIKQEGGCVEYHLIKIQRFVELKSIVQPVIPALPQTEMPVQQFA